MVYSVINFCIYMCIVINGSKLFETFNAGNMNLLLEFSRTILPEIYSITIDCGLGCPVCILKPLVYVPKRSENCLNERGSGLPQNV